jgi:DNA mismatch endonuclease, patch repair protein
VDTLTPKERSHRMSLVRSKDTGPEILVRRIVHSLGYRYRLHVHALPGCPDLVFPKRQCVILIHGCFWHQHKCRMGDRMPKSRIGFWRSKLEGNKRRDSKQRRSLRSLGWRVLTIWECQLSPRKTERLRERIIEFLGGGVGRTVSSSRHFHPIKKGRPGANSEPGNQRHKHTRHS